MAAFVGLEAPRYPKHKAGDAQIQSAGANEMSPADWDAHPGR